MKTAFSGMGRLATAFLVTLFILPNFALAATNVSTRTVQLLPPNGTSCSQIAVTSVTSYVYDDALHSFDVVIPDVSYVSIGASVGNTIIPFRYMTRAMTPDGQLRIHTDVDSTLIQGSLPVSITLISAKQGSPVCAATVAFTVGGIVSVPSTSAPVPVSAPQPSQVPQPAAPATNAPATTSGAVSTTTGVTTSSLAKMCAGSGAYQLWFILLALYLVIAAIAALAQPSLMERSPAIPVALILVPLILLVGFWYFSPGCRAASWIPIALLIIAIVGLLVAFRERKGMPLLLSTMPHAPKPPASAGAPKAPQTPQTKPAAPTIILPAKTTQTMQPGSTKPVQGTQQSSQQKPPQQKQFQ